MQVYKELTITWPEPPGEETAGLLAAWLGEVDTLGWSEETIDGGGLCWRIYFDEGHDLDPVREGLADCLKQAPGNPGMLSESSVPDQDWMAKFRAYFHGTAVAPCWWVAPPWETENAQLKPGDHLLVIEPGMAFGTGLHETTRLCLKMLAENAPGVSRVIDAGAGSGILSVACAKLGVSDIVAVEIGEKAAVNLRHNLALNHLESRVDVRVGDLQALNLAPAPVVVCNMERQHFCPLFDALRGLIEPGGLLLASGFILEGRDEVETLFAQGRLDVLDRYEDGGWLAYRLRG